MTYIITFSAIWRQSHRGKYFPRPGKVGLSTSEWGSGKSVRILKTDPLKCVRYTIGTFAKVLN